MTTKELEYQIAELLRDYHTKTGKWITIGTVESATGGRISDRITAVPGSSEYYMGSIISYSNDVKTRIVGVDADTLSVRGAVSSETAIEMAAGGRELLKVDVCISDTGIAGPSGDTPGKPVGLFYIAIASEDTTLSEQHKFHGNREENNHNAAVASLNLLKDYLITRIDKFNDTNFSIHKVVTCFLEHHGKILLLKRSDRVREYKNSWAAISGYITADALKQAYIEMKEETSLDPEDIGLHSAGEPLEIIDQGINKKWIVHPFLFHINSPDKIVINWEHTEIQWISTDEFGKFHTVPGLKQALERVLR
jgi:nicotinamide-nucleotide amidase